MQITMYMSSTPSRHLAQILVGWAKWLKKNRETAIIEYFDTHIPEYDFVLKVEFANKKIVYDVADGYMKNSIMNDLLEWCDLYFKRSCNKSENLRYQFAEKIYPLGFNYYMSDISLAKISMDLIDYYDVVISDKNRLKQLMKYFITGKTHLCEPWVFEKSKSFNLASTPQFYFLPELGQLCIQRRTILLYTLLTEQGLGLLKLYAQNFFWGGGMPLWHRE